jgi:hypothetical protein
MGIVRKMKGDPAATHSWAGVWKGVYCFCLTLRVPQWRVLSSVKQKGAPVVFERYGREGMTVR